MAGGEEGAFSCTHGTVRDPRTVTLPVAPRGQVVSGRTNENQELAEELLHITQMRTQTTS